MHFLYASNKDRKTVILHIRGFANKDVEGFVNGEGVFLVEATVDNLNMKLNMQVVKQVGTVCKEGHRIQINYTDEEFKLSIGYNEATGYSTMDGALWQTERTTYIDSTGSVTNMLTPYNSPGLMYNGAKNPFMQMPSYQSFISASPAREVEPDTDYIQNLTL